MAGRQSTPGLALTLTLTLAVAGFPWLVIVRQAGQTPLWSAAEFGHRSVVSALCEVATDVDEPPSPQTPCAFHLAGRGLAQLPGHVQ
eukprot:1993589-Pyramimonas_sp.AAC.1